MPREETHPHMWKSNSR